MISVLVSGSSRPGSSCGRGHCPCLEQDTLLWVLVPLSTKMHKLVLVNVMLGVTLRWTSIPSMGWGRGKTPSNFRLQKLGLALA